MKKLLLGIIAIITIFALVACGNKEEEPEVAPVEQTEVVETAPEVTPAEPTEEEQQMGVGNTDEGMVALVLEQHFKEAYSGEVEELNPVDIKVYTPDEISGDASLSTYTINPGDIVFDASYELKIAEGVEDMMKYTAGTGDIDGQWIREKHNVGILRTGENGYTLDAFGTAF